MVYFMENPIKMDDLGVPPFLETSISIFLGVSGWSFLLGWGLLEVDEVFHLPPWQKGERKVIFATQKIYCF